MAWLESHGNLARHPKTRRLMQRMGWSLPHTIGNLHLLWYWALDFAPTGDLTKFEPEQLTYDLDLGGATPEQFIEAMLQSGFIDKEESGTLRLHDWPDYTTKCLRPKFRRHPERWHQVLTNYDRPIPPGRRSREQSDSHPGSHARHTSHSDVGAVRAVPNFPQEDCATQTVQQTAPTPTCGETYTRHTSPGDVGVADIPLALVRLPGFVDTWWPKLLAMYESKGTPLDRRQRQNLLARLHYRPNSAIQLIKHCIEHSLDCKWEHLANTS